MATHDPPSDKPALRRLARARRDAIAPGERARAAHAAAARIDAHVLAALPAGATVALYAAMRSELSCAAVAAAAAARGLATAYPRTLDDVRRLVFHRAAAADLVPGRFSIPEPPAALPVVELAEVAVVIVPGLLFDRDGYRLGWGGGWYDATLAGTRALRVGLTLEALRVDALPRAPHDQPVHLVATELALHAGAARAEDGP